MKGQMMGTRVPVIIIGLILFVIGILFLLPMIGMNVLPIDLSKMIPLPADVAGIPMMFIMAGLTAIGLIMLLVGIVNPNYMLQ